MTRDGDDATVVVPWAAGPVLRPGGTPSDVDALLDEMFGRPDSGGPGWFDLVLLVGGVLAVVRGWVVFGAVLIVLGLALPVRSLARRARRLRYRAVLSRGLPLAVGHPATAALVTAYENVVAAGDEEAVEAAHRAVVECASLLGGRAPSTPEETRYVTRRADAIRAVATVVPYDIERVAAVRAREELDAISGRTSVDELLDAAARRSRRGR